MLLDFLNNHRADLQYVASLVLGLALWRWGGGPERGMAIMFTGVIMLPVIIFRLLSTGTMLFGSLAPLYVALDVIGLVGFVWIALHANRNYPLWVAGLQLIAVGTHLVTAFVTTVSPIAYVVLVVGPSYGQLGVLAFGLLRHHNRVRQFGAYRDWRVDHDLPRIAALLSGRGSQRAG